MREESYKGNLIIPPPTFSSSAYLKDNTLCIIITKSRRACCLAALLSENIKETRDECGLEQAEREGTGWAKEISLILEA